MVGERSMDGGVEWEFGDNGRNRKKERDRGKGKGICDCETVVEKGRESVEDTRKVYVHVCVCV